MIKNAGMTFESQGISTFIVYETSVNKIDTQEIQFLEKQEYSGLLSCVPYVQGETSCLRYHLINGNSLEEYYSGQLTKTKICVSLIGIIETLIELQAKGINIDNILLNEKYIFIDNDQQCHFIYLPFPNQLETTDILAFIKKIFFSYVLDESDNALFFVRLHNYLVNLKEYNMFDLKAQLREIGNWKNDVGVKFSSDEITDHTHFYSPTEAKISSVERSIPDVLAKREGTLSGGKVEIEEELQYKRITKADVGDGYLNSPNDFGETSIRISSPIGFSSMENTSKEEEAGTTVLGNIENYEEDDIEGTTTLDGQRSFQKPYIVSKSSLEKAYINKDTFKIGRDPNNTDYTLNNKVVGRVHAKILTSDNTYFLKDNESRNGTFLNGVRLQPLERKKIKHEDVIRLANEEFEFRVF